MKQAIDCFGLGVVKLVLVAGLAVTASAQSGNAVKPDLIRLEREREIATALGWAVFAQNGVFGEILAARFWRDERGGHRGRSCLELRTMD